MKSSESNAKAAEAEASWFADLLDIRVVVFLVCVVVVAMTATVLMFSGNQETSTELPQVPVTAGEIRKPISDSTLVESDENQADSPTDSELGMLSLQAPDASFKLPVRSATLVGCAIGNASNQDRKGLSNWQQEGQATWRLKVEQRRSGFFYCHVTYQAKSECQFAVRLGDGKPRRFTLYPTDVDFEERFIVRLDKPDVQTLKLIANQLETGAGITIRKVELIPQK